MRLEIYAFASLFVLLALAIQTSAYPTFDVSPEDDEFLDVIERASFLFFWEQTNSSTGQVRDSGYTNGSFDGSPPHIAATGWGLSALCIAHNRSYLDPALIENRVNTTISFIHDKLQGENGFYYFWGALNDSGLRFDKAAISPIDSAMLIFGVLTVRQYFKNNTVIYNMCTDIYYRVNYTWMLNNGTFFSCGWTPEDGFSQYIVNMYTEYVMLYLQAMGSPTFPVPTKGWDTYMRPTLTYNNITFIKNIGNFFVNQYPHSWIDYFNNTDSLKVDYFQNTVKATQVLKEWSITDLVNKNFEYNENLWGLTCSECDLNSPTCNGYADWSVPGHSGKTENDGTVVPCAAGGSIPFLPNDTIAVLRNINATYPKAWGRYGFVDAFNPIKNWYSNKNIGIDVGPLMLMAENYISSFVWKMVMQNPEIVKGMLLAGFECQSGWACDKVKK